MSCRSSTFLSISVASPSACPFLCLIFISKGHRFLNGEISLFTYKGKGSSQYQYEKESKERLKQLYRKYNKTLQEYVELQSLINFLNALH